MSFRGAAYLEKLDRRAVGYALVTSVFVAAYTLADGSGARLASTASSYAVWLFLSDASVVAAARPWHCAAGQFCRGR